MVDELDLRHATIVLPEHTHTNQVKALAEQRAQSLVGKDAWVVDVQLGTAHPVGGEHSTEMEWPYSFQVVPPGGSAAHRP